MRTELDDLPRTVLAKGTPLFHGTDCAGDFEIPDGPAWFADSFETAAYWAGWNFPAHDREDGERRVHVYVVAADVALLDLDAFADDVAGDGWIRLAELAAGVSEEITRDEMAAALKAKGVAGWLGHGEVMLTSPELVLSFERTTVVEGENPLRPVPSTYRGAPSLAP